LVTLPRLEQADAAGAEHRVIERWGRSVIAPPSDAVAIVTGGSYAIGREIARTLAHRGYAIVVVYLDDQRRAEATVDEILAGDGTAVTVRADVTDDLDVERLFDETIAAFGGVDAVVHTATRSASVLYQQAATDLGFLWPVPIRAAESGRKRRRQRERGAVRTGLSGAGAQPPRGRAAATPRPAATGLGASS
jgi:NAD(P)-dependent dehydrogenase (short-subunit alcohol dehydrogenase family)